MEIARQDCVAESRVDCIPSFWPPQRASFLQRHRGGQGRWTGHPWASQTEDVTVKDTGRERRSNRRPRAREWSEGRMWCVDMSQDEEEEEEEHEIEESTGRCPPTENV